MVALRWALVALAVTCIGIVAHTRVVNGVAVIAFVALVGVVLTFVKRVPQVRDDPGTFPYELLEQLCPCPVDHAEADECDAAVPGEVVGWVVVERRPDRDVIVSASVQWLEILVTRERAERAAARLTAERAMRAARASHGMHWPNYTYFAAPVLAEEDLSRLDRLHGVGSRS